MKRSRDARSQRESRFTHRLLFALKPIPALAVLLALVAGCSVLRTPQKVVQAVVPVVGGEKQPDPIELQVQIQRFTDDYASRTIQSLDDYARITGTEAGRIQALNWKLTSLSSMVAIASGPNPNVNLLDLVAVNTLTRIIVEERAQNSTNGPAFQTWVANSRVLETNAWRLAAAFLKPAQLDELRAGIHRWYQENPGLHDGFLARPSELVAMIRTTPREQRGVDSVFNLVGLDPTIGLDPAVREVTKTRLFAERAMYTLQRMPVLIRWQSELLAYDLTQLPEVRQVVSNSTRLSASADTISRTAAELPDRITAERKAILAALEQQESKLRDLSAEVNRTLQSGAAMSDSLNVTITNFDTLMKRFGVGEPDTNSAAAADTNSPPFNILDYGKVADQIGGMARELNVLLTTANQNATQLTRLSDEATAKVDHAVDRAFRRGVMLIVIFLVGSVLAGLVYHALRRK